MQVDAALISQAFRSPTDSTLLRPFRPLSFVDAYYINASFNLGASHDIRSTHSIVPKTNGSGGPHLTTHYVVAWRTTTAVTLGPFDLFPAPAANTPLMMRAHILAPAGPGQLAGCTNNTPAVGSCVMRVPASTSAVIAATGTALNNFSLTVLYEPLENGAYFLGG